MKRLANYASKIRAYLGNKKNYSYYLDFKYKWGNYFGRIRGLKSILYGRVSYDDMPRPFILGKNIDFHMEPGSSIVLRAAENKIDFFPINRAFPNASSIGIDSHWNFMHPPIGRPTRIRLKANSKLIMGENTAIYKGSYIAVWPNKTLEISDNVCIAQGVFINTRSGLKIGKNVLIAHEATIMDYDGHPIFNRSELQEENELSDSYGGTTKAIVIEDNVWIGFRAIILKGCRIGAGSIVGAGSCVRQDVPPNSIVIGNPAKVIRKDVSWRKY